MSPPDVEPPVELPPVEPLVEPPIVPLVELPILPEVEPHSLPPWCIHGGDELGQLPVGHLGVTGFGSQPPPILIICPCPQGRCTQ